MKSSVFLYVGVMTLCLNSLPLKANEEDLLCYHSDLDIQAYNYAELAETETVYKFFLEVQNYKGNKGKNHWIQLSGEDLENAALITSMSPDDSVTLGHKCQFSYPE